MKKMEMAMAVGAIIFVLSSCGKTEDSKNLPEEGSVAPTKTVEHTNSETKENQTSKEEESVVNQQEGNMQEAEDTSSETSVHDDEDAGLETGVQDVGDPGLETGAQEAEDTGWKDNVQKVEDTGLRATADELFDSFINGSISAVRSTDLTSTFYITDLDMDSGEWDAYSVGERVDLDNDGEDELIICGPYGGIYLDARDDKVYEFAAGGGTALVLSYTYYNGAIWIMYSNRSSAGFEFYHMEKFGGADNLVAEMNFGEEFDINNAEVGLKYTLNGTEISYDEYTQLCSKIFATEETTYVRNGANHDSQITKEDMLENLRGEYDYLLDNGTGKLIIKNTSSGYDISDYESESFYRFLADSSNIETIENNRIYIKYPEQVFSDDTVNFSYYILEYGTDGIDVYYGKSMFEETQFLYHATKTKNSD